MHSLQLRGVSAPASSENPDGEAAGGPVARIVHETLQEQTYQELRKAIREGRFMSGQALTMRGLAGMLGVSPMPVREAVRRLAQEKTLEILPNRTMRVPLLSAQRFDELADVRAELEGYAAGRAAERMTTAEFAEIKAANEDMSRAVDRGNTADVNMMNERFHFAVYRAAQSETLLSAIEGLWQQSGPYLASLIHRLMSGSDMPVTEVKASLTCTMSTRPESGSSAKMIIGSRTLSSAARSSSTSGSCGRRSRRPTSSASMRADSR